MQPGFPITIVDYGMGNLRSVQKGFERVGYAAQITADAERIASANKLVLPGVGAFGDAMRELHARDLILPICEHIRRGGLFLGICLGLQLLFESSDERGEFAGLGILPGRCRRFDLPAEFKVPHMGWNETRAVVPNPLIDPQASSAYYYFVHSYYVDPSDRSLTSLETTYHHPFCAMIWRDNIFATQFHPEKSQTTGLRLLSRFGGL